MQTKTISPEIRKLAANTIRMLAADGVQKANSGHPGMPMGMADCALALWTKYLKYNPKDPDWPDRDRFVLSAGHGSMLLYSLLHLAQYDVKMEDLQSFRQWDSRTPGHPEVHCLPGVETTTGPLGQGFTNGVGMAIAAKMSAARYNKSGRELFGTHKIYAIVSDGDLMEGVSSEAASLAGHLKLGNIIYLYDDNHITIEGETKLAFSESVQDRFDAYGWHTVKIDGHDHDQICNAIEEGINETGRPTLIIARTHIGYGSPNKHDTAGVHGSPLGEEELEKTRAQLGFSADKKFYVPDEVYELFKNRADENEVVYDQWMKQFEEWKKKNPELNEIRQKAIDKILPDDLEQQLVNALPESTNATRALSGSVIQKIAEICPAFVGGSADLEPSTKTWIKSSTGVTAQSFEGRNFHFGIREHAMGSINNGISLYGGFIPFGATFLVFADYMRPPVRLAAIMEAQNICVYTHDSIFVGEDGPTHQPVEQLASLRAIPNLQVMRPADGVETAVCWSMA
ncbi:MAG: transketolase, partial [Calditrichaceae bacterium]